jgi:hypothetical protein
VKIAVALFTLVIASVVWAVPNGIAHSTVRNATTVRAVGDPVRFRDDRNSGLLVDVWLNGSGPFNFAIDTGAGITVITRRVVERSNLTVQRSSRPLVGGLSASPISSRDETRLANISVGRNDNILSSTSIAAVVDSLPGSLDGILDPIDAFKPSGFEIDLPNRTITQLTPGSGLKGAPTPRDGAIVKWIREPGSHKPFVRLSDGGLALVDTGSSFGFALNGRNLNRPTNGERIRTVNDLGGGVRSQKIAPQTVSIGELELRGVPTDVLFGVAADTPTILGRRALYPFKITFDPAARLIAFEPIDRN